MFVGTIDYIRQDTILHLIESTKEQGKELWILGKKKSDYLDDLNESHVTYIEPTWDVEKYIKQCDETAGILLGRTTIEGWLCDRPGWIYDVDSSGNISSYKLHEVPEDVDKFKSEKVIEETIKEYIKNYIMKLLIKFPTRVRARKFLKVLNTYVRMLDDKTITYCCFM